MCVIAIDCCCITYLPASPHLCCYSTSITSITRGGWAVSARTCLISVSTQWYLLSVSRILLSVSVSVSVLSNRLMPYQ